VDGQTFTLELDQAANATTIAAVGKRDGLPDHAVTIALATAMQESGLRNLPYGDRDSLGLFQQRPSQGWGTAAQVSTTTYAAAAFYRKLETAPDAYARWEAQSRVLAQALTGEVPGAFSCRVSLPRASVPSAQLAEAMASEIGRTADALTPTPAQGWTTATWLVGHADEQRVSTVTFGGERWTARSGRWAPVDGAPTDGPVVVT
jgi:hypothetical protein